ncbi:MAG: glycoside hydrolase family 18 protein [Proteobacteria bacterium]|nr:glycoside hydrolase family 18 protein [Pseudomonadota bacterium]MCP4921859.1 glycoside hydrolase family 18 protein [Pseudomonadota bacterium]
MIALLPFAFAGPHHDQLLDPPDLPALDRRQKLPPGPPPDMWVYGYYATWAGELEDLDWSRLTHVAIFWVDMNSDGTVDSTSNWTDNAARAMELAEPHGTRVHLTLTCFDDDVMESVLPSATKRATLVETLGTLVDDYGAHGVSVDCEGMSSGLKDHLVSFVTELNARVDEVTVATPAIDWNGAYDYDALAANSAALFIMGYGYHWSGGDPGPVAPLYGGDRWSSYSLEWSVEDYRTWGTPDDKIIVGLPLYGREWPTTSNEVPGTATATGSAVVMTEAVGLSYERLYDTQTETPYKFPSSTSQLWYDDTESIGAKMQYAADQELLGVGFWALNYEGGDPAFWQMVSDVTGVDDPGDPDSGQDSAPADDSALDTDDDRRGSVFGDPDAPVACGCSGIAPAGASVIAMSWFLLALRRRRSSSS